MRYVTLFGETLSIYEQSFKFEAKVWSTMRRDAWGRYYNIVEILYLFVSSYVPGMLHHFVNLLKIFQGLIHAQGFNGLMRS